MQKKIKRFIAFVTAFIMVFGVVAFSPMTALADQDTVTVTFDANGGEFANDELTDDVIINEGGTLADAIDELDELP
ncbi:MAG: hypothetical protein FWE33_07035, partial [Defluviitaleaceae bacterium]|nr:hypothetical protein [Defluviitaleaceae bacterium]